MLNAGSGYLDLGRSGETESAEDQGDERERICQQATEPCPPGMSPTSTPPPGDNPGEAKAGASLCAGDNSWAWEKPGTGRRRGRAPGVGNLSYSWKGKHGGPREGRAPGRGAPGLGRQSAETSDTPQITSPGGKTTSPGHRHTTSPERPRGCHQSPEVESPHTILIQPMLGNRDQHCRAASPGAPRCRL